MAQLLPSIPILLALISWACGVPTARNISATRHFQVDAEDAHLSVPQLILKYGYGAEVHHATTEDGYILELHRIPKPGAPVVLLMHGLLCSSADWVSIGPGNGLAYLLADQGYDVWLGNARGNRYSRKHRTLTPKMFAFWQFSWHEIGFYDLPASIDYVLEKTGRSKLHYIGHSQGTTSFFVMTSTRPEYNAKIALAQALAPVAFTENMQSPLLRIMALFQDTLAALFETFGVAEFAPSNAILHDISKVLCTAQISNNLCLNVLFQLAGANPDQVDLKLIPILMGHTPAGASTKQIVHYAQGVRSGRFRQYDHGTIKNRFVYGTADPPVYNLTQVTAPVVFYYALNDYLAVPVDVERLSRGIGNLAGYRQVRMETFNHLDFLFAKDVRTLLYEEILGNVRRYGG